MNQTSVPTTLNRGQTAPLLRKPVIIVPPATSRSGSRRRTARRTVLCGLAAVLLAHVALAASMETRLPQLRDPEYGYRLVRVREQQRLHPDRPLVLMLGTSRTQNAIDPASMGLGNEPGSPLVFNFGLSGAHPIHQRLNLQRLLADGVRPAAVVVEICPPTLAVPAPADLLFTKQATRLTARDLQRLEPYLENPVVLDCLWGATRINPWYTQRLLVMSHLVPEWLPWQQRLNFQWELLDEFGFAPFPTDKADEHRAERRERAFTQYGVILRDLRVSELAKQAYRDLIEDCRAHGVRVAFYLAPESPTFQSWYQPCSREALAAFTRNLSEEFGCPVFAASADYAEEEFADGHHILPSGAARFSRWLVETHLKPWMASGR